MAHVDCRRQEKEIETRLHRLCSNFKYFLVGKRGNRMFINKKGGMKKRDAEDGKKAKPARNSQTREN